LDCMQGNSDRILLILDMGHDWLIRKKTTLKKEKQTKGEKFKKRVLQQL